MYSGIQSHEVIALLVGTIVMSLEWHSGMREAYHFSFTPG